MCLFTLCLSKLIKLSTSSGRILNLLSLSSQLNHYISQNLGEMNSFSPSFPVQNELDDDNI